MFMMKHHNTGVSTGNAIVTQWVTGATVYIWISLVYIAIALILQLHRILYQKLFS